MPLNQTQQIWPIGGFLSPSLTATDPSIPYLPLESPEAAPESGPPGGRSRAMLAGIVAAWSVVTAVPLWAAVLLQPVPVDAPPLGHEARTAAVQAQVVETWTPPPHESQRRRTLPQAGVAIPDKVPVVDASQFPISQWPQPSWDTQRARTLPQGSGVLASVVPFTRTSQQPISQWEIPSWPAPRRGRLTVSVDPPMPLHAAKVLDQGPVWQWPPSDWPAQSAKRLSQSILPSVPVPVSAAAAVQRVLQSHYAPPVMQPLWASVLLQPVPVDPPPPSHPARISAIQIQQQASWISAGYELPSRRLLPRAGAVAASVPFVETAQQPISQWHAQTWEAQRRPFLPPGVAPADAPVPRVSSALLPIRHWSEPAWEIPARRVLIQPAAIAQVPSLRTNHLPIALQGASTWESQRRPWLIIVNDRVPFSRINQLPIALVDVQAWAAQTRPRIIVSVDPPPVLSRRPALPIILTQWETGSVALQRRLALPSSVDVPPLLSRASQAIMAQWEPITWPAQSRGDLAGESVVSSVRYIRVASLSGSLATCVDVVGTLPTAEDVQGAMSTASDVSGALPTIAGVTGTLPTAENITGVL